MAKITYTVEVTELRVLFNLLEKADKKASDILKKRITKAARDVATQASYLAPARNPVGGWGAWATPNGRDLSYDGAQASRGFKARQNQFKKRGVSTGIAFEAYQSNAGASVFEVIGSGKRVTTASGAHLVGMVNERFPGRQPRSLFRAYYQVMTPNLQQEIADDIEAAARKLGLD